MDSPVEYVLDISTDASTANGAILAVDIAISDVSNVRGRLGAYHRRLEHIATNLGNYEVNLQSAKSRIRDADYAKEIMGNTKVSILLQSTQAMMIQANQHPNRVLELLNG